jgi:tRNA-2-methylthio-N6-dimethylallyladenosine synthase
LAEVIEVQMRTAREKNKQDIGKVYRVLVEGFSKKSEDNLQGRNDQNKVVVFPKEQFQKGDYVDVLIQDCTNATLMGTAVK